MLITAGCGISQITWPDWPTWPKYCKLMFECNHLNIGAPAAGNWYIANALMKSIVENINSVECVIVTWTNHEKLDLFVDQTNPVDDIRSFNSRNWMLDWNGRLTDNNRGWWPSSVSDDNYFKESYCLWQNSVQHALTSFHCILQLQQFCQQKNIPLYNFMSYDLRVEEFSQNPDTAWLVNSIDWDSWPDTSPLAHHYYQSKWFRYEVTKQQGLIPVAGWHWDIFLSHFYPVLKTHFDEKYIQKDKINLAVQQLTEKKFNEYSN